MAPEWRGARVASQDFRTNVASCPLPLLLPVFARLGGRPARGSGTCTGDEARRRKRARQPPGPLCDGWGTPSPTRRHGATTSQVEQGRTAVDAEQRGGGEKRREVAESKPKIRNQRRREKGEGGRGGTKPRCRDTKTKARRTTRSGPPAPRPPFPPPSVESYRSGGEGERQGDMQGGGREVPTRGQTRRSPAASQRRTAHSVSSLRLLRGVPCV